MTAVFQPLAIQGSSAKFEKLKTLSEGGSVNGRSKDEISVLKEIRFSALRQKDRAEAL
jgi:hypothetical protein